MSQAECRACQFVRALAALVVAAAVLGCDALNQRESYGTVAQASTGFNSIAVQNTAQVASAAGSFAAIARDVTPAVVAVDAEFSPDAAPRTQGRLPGMPPRARPRATGSGFLVTRDGYILTNNHVVANAQRVVVGLVDRRILPARVIGHDPSTDVALIKVEGGTFRLSR